MNKPSLLVIFGLWVVISILTAFRISEARKQRQPRIIGAIHITGKARPSHASDVNSSTTRCLQIRSDEGSFYNLAIEGTVLTITDGQGKVLWTYKFKEKNEGIER